MKASITFLCFFLSLMAWGQDESIITLPQRSFDIIDRKFFIERVIDQRQDKSSIGHTISTNSDMTPARLENGLQAALEKTFAYAMPRAEGQFPVTVAVRRFSISESSGYQGKTAYVRLSLEFYYQNQFVFKSDQYNEMALDGRNTHGENIVRALEMGMKDFSSSYVVREISGASEEQKPVQASRDVSKTDDKVDVREDNTEIQKRLSQNEEMMDRNVMAIGYQIGGYTLIGLDYEIRASDYFGVHFGAGFSGYTAGVKIHTDVYKDSPFFNISLKDGGFGLIKAGAVEYGWRWVGKNTGGFGFHGQVGLAKIISIDPDFEKQVFGVNGAPSVMFSLGLGVSW